jgi:hypothetical protein
LLQAWFRLKSFRKCFPIYFKKRKMLSSRNQASQGPSRPFCPKRHARGFSSRAAAHTQEALAWPLHSLCLSHARSRPAETCSFSFPPPISFPFVLELGRPVCRGGSVYSLCATRSALYSHSGLPVHCSLFLQDCCCLLLSDFRRRLADSINLRYINRRGKAQRSEVGLSGKNEIANFVVDSGLRVMAH